MSTHYLFSNFLMYLVIWMQSDKPIGVRWDLHREFVLLQLLVSNALTQLAVFVRHVERENEKSLVFAYYILEISPHMLRTSLIRLFSSFIISTVPGWGARFRTENESKLSCSQAETGQAIKQAVP